MRLTLRTLLAYMDGELERVYPKEAQEIGKKIQSSKFATDLFHKIRDVMRRLRLAAPSVTERGANLDCNTVAEYLDNELPDDRVPDFEEVCLKSDMHLAEVASCHQILAIAQVEPIEVDPESRERMYRLPTVAGRVDEERLAAAEAATVLSGDGSATAPSSPPVKVRPRPVVPEYLREPARKRRLLPVAAIMLLVGAAAGLVLAMTGQFNQGTPVGNLLAWAEGKINGKPPVAEPNKGGQPNGGVTAKSSSATPATAPSGAGPAPSGTPSKSSGAAPDVPSGGTLGTAPSRDSATPPGDPAAFAPLASPPESTQPTPGADPSAAGRPVPSSTAAASATVPPPSIEAPLPAPPSDPGTTPAVPPTVAGATSPIIPVEPPRAEIRPVPPGNPTLRPSPEEKPRTPPRQASPSPGPNEAAMLTPKPAAPAADDKDKPDDKDKNVARYTSDGQDVLLTQDGPGKFWRRALPEEFFTANQRLLALPTYRSRIDIFQVGARVELFNGTRAELLPASAKLPMGAALDYGRLVVKPLEQAGARLRIIAGTHSGILTLKGMESVAALEVSRIHEPGTEPEKVLSHALTKLYVARGGASWEEGDKPPVQFTSPAVAVLDDLKSSSSSAADIPKWISANTINEREQRAAVSVSQDLRADRAATVGLRELAEARQQEVRDLAARCLGYLGEFDPLTAALDDTKFTRNWRDYYNYYNELKEAIARGPETASAIRQSLAKRFTDNAPELYRMLWGYTDKNLEGGEDARLVGYLDHEALVFRVLAFSNLWEITNKGHSYRPEVPSAKRVQPLQLWKQDLRLGYIRHAPRETPRTPAPPTPLPASETTPPDSDLPPGEDTTSVQPTGDMEPIDAPRGGPAVRRSTAVTPEPASSAPRPRLVYPEPE